MLGEAGEASPTTHVRGGGRETREEDSVVGML